MADGVNTKLSVPATFGDVRAIDVWLVELLRRAEGIDEGVIQSIELAVHEISCNIVEHAYAEAEGGRIGVTFSLSGNSPRTLVIELLDSGKSFDNDAVTPVDLDTPTEGGYGLFLARSLMDAVDYERCAGQNIWRLKKML